MTLEEVHQQMMHEAVTDPAEAWSSSIPQLRAEIANLNRLLSELTTDETDAQEQLESLTYALGLTRGEVERRQRSTTELSSAYQFDDGQHDQARLEEVQRLEGELLNAKRDSANMVYEVEQLEFRLKRLREEAGSGGPLREAVSPASPGLRSPQLTSLSTKSKSSPAVRPARLIGDVDAVVRIGEAGEYAGCRLGVSASGHMAVYSYSSAVPLLYLDDRGATRADATDADRGAVGAHAAVLDVVVAGRAGRLAGLRESVEAARQLVAEACDAVRADEEL